MAALLWLVAEDEEENVAPALLLAHWRGRRCWLTSGENRLRGE
jgi:hypothetical protein